ncbi:hypothetical protein RhiirA1_542817 [Rhizophagus irregularis]|uniref:Protein kinase domain-containing protein n=1 Tax=Rhizophagus irregularis TaxID=588596 RepID=A0A2N0QU92_9GLOM|nr:hypothetical protein RhiirA1_542817 [Rhizophagus irregularis]
MIMVGGWVAKDNDRKPICKKQSVRVNLVGEKYREPFSENSQIPEKFKNLVINESKFQFDFSISSGAMIEAAVLMLVPFTKFLPLINEIEKIFYEIIELVEAAEHNKRTYFDSCINLLSFSINVKISDELGQLKADQDDLAKYLQEMVSGITVDEKNIGDDTKEVKDYLTDLSNKFSSTVAKVSVMNKTMEKFMNEVHPLKLSNYGRDDSEPRKWGRVTKWYNIIKGQEFAFKTISEKEDQNMVQNQVTILKELHDWQNIIKFYGLVSL